MSFLLEIEKFVMSLLLHVEIEKFWKCTQIIFNLALNFWQYQFLGNNT